MINFFRKIRKKLADDNKPLKYMRYAIGEIVLVVIGILIALQINAWNTDRLNRIKEQEHLSQLTRELKAQLLYYQDLKEQFAVVEKRVSRVVNIWASKKPIIKDSMQYLGDIRASGATGYWHKEPVVWLQLLETGKIDLIRNKEITDGLYTFYDRIEKQAENFNSYVQKLIFIARGHINKIHVDIPINELMDNWEKAATLGLKNQNTYPDTIYEEIWDMRMDMIIDFRTIATSCRIQQMWLKPTIKTGEELLVKLEAAQGITTE
ncbi:DUF6090 family protein [Eudoraea adriatica]|uniref:DUF6090 family protein n=1 Tax=Eudoraea adriatica TaxID=446681 RepID=UPI00037EC92C|nr:DUF6090 family protein [Eudoraea adriatica]